MGVCDLDRNHSHFILVQNEKGGGFGDENKLRGALEGCMRDMKQAFDIEIEDYLKDPFRTYTERANRQKPTKRGKIDASVDQEVPIVTVCVQGGPGSFMIKLNAGREHGKWEQKGTPLRKSQPRASPETPARTPMAPRCGQ